MVLDSPFDWADEDLLRIKRFVVDTAKPAQAKLPYSVYYEHCNEVKSMTELQADPDS